MSDATSRTCPESRVLVTANIRDFGPILREWAGEGRSQAGVILVPSSVGIGVYEVLISSIQTTPADTTQKGWVDRVEWLLRS